MSQPQRKNVIAQVYQNDGTTFITTWDDFKFDSFIKNINGGLGECVLTLARKFDASGEDLTIGNIIELRVADKDTVAVLGANASRNVYKGFVSMIERQANGAQESITIHLLGFYSLLAMDILKSGSQTTLYSNATTGLSTTSPPAAADVGSMARAIIDRYRAETTNPQMNYNADDMPLTSTSGTYHITQKTYADALESLRKVAPAHTFYYVDENGMVHFKTGSTTPDHTFTIGRDISKITTQANVETMRNEILVWDGKASGLYTHYEDADSIATYGRKTATLTDYGINNQTTSDLVGNKFIVENKDPEVKVTATIIDNNGPAGFGYDIESIQPGDTCVFQGFDVSFNKIFTYNMLITQVTYRLDSADIVAEVVRTNLQDIQYKNDRSIGELGTGILQIPDSYA